MLRRDPVGAALQRQREFYLEIESDWWGLAGVIDEATMYYTRLPVITEQECV